MTQNINAEAARNGRVIQANSNSALKDNLLNTVLRRLTLAWPLVIFLLLPALTRAETAVQAWVQRYNGPGNGNDQATAIAVDGSNNIIVTGYSGDSGGGEDYATIKYSSAGVPIWTNRYNRLGNGNNEPHAVAVDGNNDVIVTGASYDSGGNSDYATLKYSSAGLPLWTNLYNGPANGSDVAWAVVVDGSNNVIVTGYSTGSGSSGEYATIQYSSGGVPLWTNRYRGTGTGPAGARAVAVDSSNNAIVAGGSFGSGSSVDYATIQYSNAGVPLWTNRYNGPANGDDWITAVAVDCSNNVIVMGTSTDSITGYDYATIKYSSAGVPLWTNRYNGPANGDDYACALVVDGSNSVIVTGYSRVSGSGGDYATIKYSGEGVPLWTNRYNGLGKGNDRAYAVALDGSGNVIVTGYSLDSLGANSYYATIKYSGGGVPLWTNRYNGSGSGGGQATAVVVDRSGNVIVTGYNYDNATHSDFATVKYTCVPSPVVSGLQLTNGAFQMRVDDVLQPGTLVIEAATNLSTTNWAPVFTNIAPTNVLFYTDPDAGNAPARFYRAFQFP